MEEEHVYYNNEKEDHDVVVATSKNENQEHFTAESKSGENMMKKRWLVAVAVISLLGNFVVALIAVGLHVTQTQNIKASLLSAVKAEAKTNTTAAPTNATSMLNDEMSQLLQTNMKNFTAQLVKVQQMNDKVTMDLRDVKSRNVQDCSDDYLTVNFSGIINISRYNKGVLCDKGWTVFQRRIDGSVDFYQPWTKYIMGFGSTEHEYWLGLDTLHQMTKGGDYMLKVELEGIDGGKGNGTYQTFIVGDATNKYRLTVDGFQGNVRDSLAYHNGFAFSTFDLDNDASGFNCASRYHGAWWFKGCHASNLNGQYGISGAKGAVWQNWKNTYNALKSIKMMIRKK